MTTKKYQTPICWPLHFISILTVVSFGQQLSVIVDGTFNTSCIQRLKQCLWIRRATFHLWNRHCSVRNKGWSCDVNCEWSQFATLGYSLMLIHCTFQQNMHWFHCLAVKHLSLVLLLPACLLDYLVCCLEIPVFLDLCWLIYSAAYESPQNPVCLTHLYINTYSPCLWSQRKLFK